MRGRVIAIGGDQVVVRCGAEHVTRTNPGGWKLGQFVDLDALVAIDGRAATGDYPRPDSEVMRMPPARMQRLRERAEVVERVRRFFHNREFLEIDTPILVPSPGLEIHLEAVPAGGGYLITSPEYQMKRLLAAGFERIYQVCKCFRAHERGQYHAMEFSMIEWYRAFATLDAIRDDTEQLVYAVCGEHARVGERRINVHPPWLRMTVRHAMRTHAGIDVDGDEPAAALVAKVRAASIERGHPLDLADDCAWDDAFFAAFLAFVEPQLAHLDRALILEDWPAPLAALARRKDGDMRTALRFEAYIGGVELANAFDELIDPVEQRARFADDQRIRAERGKPVYPLDEKLIAALAEGLPPSAGIALGLDRLVMLATGADSIDEVLAFSGPEL